MTGAISLSREKLTTVNVYNTDNPTLESLTTGDSLSSMTMVGAAGKILDFACPRSSKIALQHPRRSNQQQELSHIMEARNSVKETRVRYWEKLNFAIAHQTSLPALLACLGLVFMKNTTSDGNKVGFTRKKLVFYTLLG